MLLFIIQQRERIQTFLPSRMWFTRQTCKPTSVKEPISECYTGTYSCKSCYVQLKSLWPIQWNPVSLMSFYQTKHVQFHSTYHTVLKSLTRYSNNWTRHARQYSIHSWLEEKLENIGSQPIVTQNLKTKVKVFYDNKVVKKYSYRTMVSSTKQSPGFWESLGW